MRSLWSPWRMKYLLETPSGECIFCERAAGGDDLRDLVLLRGRHHYVILNIYPYGTGHLMLVSNRHVPLISGLSSEERAEAAELLVKVERAVREVYGPDGANLGINLGRCAGAGVEGHLHLHYVPRRRNDTEDAASRSATDPPEDLGVTFGKLRAALGARV